MNKDGVERYENGSLSTWCWHFSLVDNTFFKWEAQTVRPSQNSGVVFETEVPGFRVGKDGVEVIWLVKGTRGIVE